MSWRYRLRDLALTAVVVAMILSVVGFAWMTRQPRHPLFETLAGVPVAGALLDELRRPYLRRSTEAVFFDRDLSSPESTRAPREGSATSDTSAEPQTEWIGIGAQLYSQPSRSSRKRSKTVRLAQYNVTERRGSWLEVELPDGSRAWVDRSEARDRTPPLGEAPEPPGPLAPRPADPKRLSEATVHFVGQQRTLDLAGYVLLTDLALSPANDDWLRSARQALSSIEQRYRQLYGLTPKGTALETIVLYQEADSYSALQGLTAGIEGVQSAGHTTGGLIALALGAREPWEAEATLVHEVGHLLNRRAIGPGLPPWLAEGIADHLALLSESDRPELSDKWRAVTGSQILYSGPLASLRLLAERAEQGTLLSLELLMRADGEAFLQSGNASLLYAQSAFLVDWLLRSPESRLGFRSFLSTVANGGAPSGEALLDQLGLSWSELDLGFRSWLIARRERAVNAGW